MSNVRLCVRLKGTGVAVYWGGGVGVGVSDGASVARAFPFPSSPSQAARVEQTKTAVAQSKALRVCIVLRVRPKAQLRSPCYRSSRLQRREGVLKLRLKMAEKGFLMVRKAILGVGSGAMSAGRPNSSAVEYKFGLFRFNCTLRRLYRQDEPVALTPKAAETLLALLERFRSRRHRVLSPIPPTL